MTPGRPHRRPRRYLIAAPGFRPWDLGTYVHRLLRDRRIPCAVFEYGRFPDEATAGASLVSAARTTRADVVIGLKLDGVAPAALEQLRRSGVRVVLWYVDCFDGMVPEWIAPRVRAADLVCVTARGMVREYQALGSAPVHWLFEGAYLPAFPRRISAGLAPYRAQVAFVGSIDQPPVPDERLAGRRRRLLRRLGRRYDVNVWGPQAGLDEARRHRLPCRILRWPAYHEELVKICRASDVILGVNTINSVELYFSNRTFLTLAAGGFHLTHYVPGLEELFENHRHLVWYRSDDECLELCEHYLQRPAARRRIAERGCDWARKRYGMRRQVARLLQLIEDQNGAPWG